MIEYQNGEIRLDIRPNYKIIFQFAHFYMNMDYIRC